MSQIKQLLCDPEVFYLFSQSLGVKNVAFNHLVSFDPQFLALPPNSKPLSITLCSLIDSKNVDDTNKYDRDSSLLFIKQITTDICGTVALLHSLMNSYPLLDLEAQSILHEIYSKFLDCPDPLEIGKFIDKNEKLLDNHNTHASALYETIGGSENHFVSYIYHNNSVYEMDGRKEAPYRIISDCPQEFFFERTCEYLSSTLDACTQASAIYSYLNYDQTINDLQ
ncbi:MAG: Ubiquitin carboxyl-terminal hydrolase isozyme L3 [Marteilia pararefringens]